MDMSLRQRRRGIERVVCPDACAAAIKKVLPMDEMIRGAGRFDARIESADGADTQTQFLDFGGRQPWDGSVASLAMETTRTRARSLVAMAVVSMCVIAATGCGSSGGEKDQAGTSRGTVTSVVTDSVPDTAADPAGLEPSTATTEEPSTTTEARVELVLSSDGLVAVSFGDPADQVVAKVSTRLGQPTKDSGVVQLAPDVSGSGYYTTDKDGMGLIGRNWKHPSYREACWQILCLEFAPSGTDHVFAGWEYSVIGDLTDPFGLKTGEGVGLGDNASVLVAAYPSVTFEQGEGYSIRYTMPWGATKLDGRVSGIVDYNSPKPVRPNPDSVVQSITAGDLLFLGCC